MSRLVVVSNRTADLRKPAAGGLAVALGDSLQQTGGLWFGWSGKILEEVDGRSASESEVHMQRAGKVTMATVDLARADYDAYYTGYANDVLWPVFHYRLDLANFDTRFAMGYRRVNQLFARKLMPLLRPDDMVWVHDYHLIPLAAELRALGCKTRMGFFLHIPMPPPLIMAAIPEHEWLVKSLFAFDLVGFQSHADLLHFSHYVESEAHAEVLGDGRFRAYDRTIRAGAFRLAWTSMNLSGSPRPRRDATCSSACARSIRAAGFCSESTGSTIRKGCRSGSMHFANCLRNIRRTAIARR